MAISDKQADFDFVEDCRHQVLFQERRSAGVEAAAPSRSPEDEALARVLFEQRMAAQRAEQVLRDGAFDLMLRTRLAGEPLTETAQRENLPLSVLAQRRWRAEVRQRQLPLAG